MKKYSQFHGNYLEDKWIANNLKLPNQGTFIDVGASDAIKRSNTYHFEMNGWTGLCIEADKFYFSDGKDKEGSNNPLPEFRNQSINAAIADYDGEISFTSRSRKSLSQVWTAEFFGADNPPSYDIKCYRLETILQKYNIQLIDILDITTRSYDWKVWNSFDYKKYMPKVIITEHSGRNYDKDDRVHDFLINTGEYELCHTTIPYYIFKHKSVDYK